MRLRIKTHRQNVSAQSSEKDEQPEFQMSQEVFDAVAKDEKEIKIGQEVPESRVQEEAGNKSKASIAKSLGRNESELRDNAAQIHEREHADERNSQTERPIDPWSVLQPSFVQLDRHADERNHPFPSLFGCFVIRSGLC